jgi:hypothetical protein
MTIRASLHPDNAVVVFHQNGGELVNAFRLHHVTFDSFVDGSRVLLVYGTQIFGLIDNCVFTASSGSIQAIKVGILSDYATAAWAAAIPQGTNKNVFIENNTFTNITTSVAQPALDADQGASVVFRYNNTTNSAIHVHGFDSASNGPRWLEIYNNAFGGTMDQAVYIRGGSAVIKSNTIATGYSNSILLRYYRSCCGISNLPDECGSFTNCPNLDPEICLAEANRCNGSNANDNNDDATGYICKQQPGTAIYTAGEYVSTPIYQWSNTWSGPVTIGISGVGGCVGYQETHMQVNRDWFNSEKSGYAAYTCPHPLTGLTGTCGSGAGTTYYNLGGSAGPSISPGVNLGAGTSVK